jgi:hypothetical protein
MGITHRFVEGLAAVGRASIRAFVTSAGVIALWAVVMLSAAPARSCACRSPRTVPVATGISPAGERWRVGAARVGQRKVEFETTVAGQPDTGGFQGVGTHRLLGDCRALIGTAEYDSGWQQIAGPVDRSVRRLEVMLADARKVSVAPALPRAGSRRNHRWLRGFRWASLFLPHNGAPIAATAFDRHGRTVTRLHEHQGLLLCRREPTPPSH